MKKSFIIDGINIDGLNDAIVEGNLNPLSGVAPKSINDFGSQHIATSVPYQAAAATTKRGAATQRKI